jgi:hypothetical protein
MPSAKRLALAAEKTEFLNNTGPHMTTILVYYAYG